MKEARGGLRSKDLEKGVSLIHHMFKYIHSDKCGKDSLTGVRE